MALKELLLGQCWTEIRATLPDDRKGMILEGLRPAMITAHAALLRNQSFRPAGSETLDQPAHLAICQSQYRCGLSLVSAVDLQSAVGPLGESAR
jgi:hypothetical protein